MTDRISIGAEAAKRLGQVVVSETVPCGFLVDDRHRVEKHIARGGMGAVYLAEDVRLSRRLAMKVLQVTARSGRVRERFEREARTTSMLEGRGSSATAKETARGRVGEGEDARRRGGDRSRPQFFRVFSALSARSAPRYAPTDQARLP